MERRIGSRHYYEIPIEVGHFNSGEMIKVQSKNHCEKGICFESPTPFQRGVILNIRIKDFHPHGPCIGLCEGLRSMTLAEVMWCREASDTKDPYYVVGTNFLRQ